VLIAFLEVLATALLVGVAYSIAEHYAWFRSDEKRDRDADVDLEGVDLDLGEE